MADSFQESSCIFLQPGDATVPYTFTFKACTTATANDGSIPNGTTISSVVVKVFDAQDTDVTVTSGIYVGDSLDAGGLVVTITLKYPTSGDGRYSIEMLATLDSGAVMEVDFTNLFALDLSAMR